MGYAYDKTISQNRKKSIDCKSGKHPKSHKSNMDLSDLSPSVRVSLTNLARRRIHDSAGRCRGR